MVFNWVTTIQVIDLVLQIGALPLWGRRRKFVTCDHEYQKAQIALAQHHGVPTFFLDWTQDPMVACYFASQRNRSESDIDKDLAIWALKTDTAPLVASGARSLDTLLPSLNIFRPSPDQNAYLASQSADFRHIFWMQKYFLMKEVTIRRWKNFLNYSRLWKYEVTLRKVSCSTKLALDCSVCARLSCALKMYRSFVISCNEKASPKPT